jgi:hypothetical protein
MLLSAPRRLFFFRRFLPPFRGKTIKNVPLGSHATMVKLQKMNGADLGVYHYERTSATRMLNSISKEMKNTLKDYLKSSNMPISILVDMTTDASVKNYLCVHTHD